MEDLERYLKDYVLPTFADLEANPTSVRHLFLTCVAVFHAVDWLAQPKRPGNLRREFRRKSDAFRIVDDVAHAFKHFSTGGPTPLRASDVIVRPPAIWGEMQFDLSRWDDPVGGVTLNSDREVDLLEVIREAISFLEKQAQREKT